MTRSGSGGRPPLRTLTMLLDTWRHAMSVLDLALFAIIWTLNDRSGRHRWEEPRLPHRYRPPVLPRRQPATRVAVTVVTRARRHQQRDGQKAHLTA